MKGRVTNPDTDRRCKLNWHSVLIIRRLRSRYVQRVIAGAWCVDQSTVSRVQNRRTWK